MKYSVYFISNDSVIILYISMCVWGMYGISHKNNNYVARKIFPLVISLVFNWAPLSESKKKKRTQRT